MIISCYTAYHLVGMQRSFLNLRVTLSITFFFIAVFLLRVTQFFESGHKIMSPCPPPIKQLILHYYKKP